MDKEEIYDEQINPLMSEILGVCKEHGIAMIASFSLPVEEDPYLMCTSYLSDGEGKHHPELSVALGIVRSYRGATMAKANTHVVTAEDVRNQPTLKAFGKNWVVACHFGILTEKDIGRYVVRVNHEMLQIENDEQFAARTA